MDIIITDVNGRQLRQMEQYNADFDLALVKTFELTVPSADYTDDMTFGARVFSPGSEIGGLVGEIHTDTQTDTVSVMGYTWRGLLSKKIIRPPNGEDYLTIHAELNEIMRQVTAGMFGDLIRVTSEGTGKVVTWQFDRYVTVYDGLTKMCKKNGYRLDIKYNQGQPGGSGWVEIGAKPIIDYSDQIELSQDNRLNFTIDDDRTGINHLIVGGAGDLAERVIVDLYVDQNGNIGDTQYYFGLDEIAEFYDFAATSDTSELKAAGETWMQDYMSKKTFRADVETLNIDVDIGDIIGGRDYITGIVVKKELANKIVTIENGKVATDYIMEGDI